MKKDIKDYLHLYLGCWCECSPPRTEIFHGQLQQIDVNGCCVVADISVTRNTHVRFIKPILRPLSSMTFEEFRKLFGENFSESYCKARIKSINSSMWVLYKTIGEIGNFDTVPNLLAEGFDLFNLINEDLVIDKTKGYETKKV